MLTYETKFESGVYKAVVWEGKTLVDVIVRKSLAEVMKILKATYPKAKEAK